MPTQEPRRELYDVKIESNFDWIHFLYSDKEKRCFQSGTVFFLLICFVVEKVFCTPHLSKSWYFVSKLHWNKGTQKALSWRPMHSINCSMVLKTQIQLHTKECVKKCTLVTSLSPLITVPQSIRSMFFSELSRARRIPYFYPRYNYGGFYDYDDSEEAEMGKVGWLNSVIFSEVLLNGHRTRVHLTIPCYFGWQNGCLILLYNWSNRSANHFT